jgi:hypothetical protein
VGTRAQCSVTRILSVDAGNGGNFVAQYAADVPVIDRRNGAGVVEAVDTEDLKSSGGQPPCGFESRPRHQKSRGFQLSRPASRALARELTANLTATTFRRRLFRLDFRH